LVVRPQPDEGGADDIPVQARNTDGAPADPPTLKTAVPNWRPGDTIPLGRRTLRVVGIRDDDADTPPALIVEESEARRSLAG
jgi:hypothetical protein